jgi:hypothetical protein
MEFFFLKQKGYVSTWTERMRESENRSVLRVPINIECNGIMVTSIHFRIYEAEVI